MRDQRRNGNSLHYVRHAERHGHSQIQKFWADGPKFKCVAVDQGGRKKRSTCGHWMGTGPRGGDREGNPENECDDADGKPPEILQNGTS